MKTINCDSVPKCLPSVSHESRETVFLSRQKEKLNEKHICVDFLHLAYFELGQMGFFEILTVPP
jgi:hypothetical protein